MKHVSGCSPRPQALGGGPFAVRHSHFTIRGLQCPSRVSQIFRLYSLGLSVAASLRPYAFRLESQGFTQRCYAAKSIQGRKEILLDASFQLSAQVVRMQPIIYDLYQSHIVHSYFLVPPFFFLIHFSLRKDSSIYLVRQLTASGR